MVSINDIYMVMSTIAITHTPPEAKNVDVKELERILRPPITVGGSIAGGVVVASQREQIEAVLAINKTNIRDLSGTTNFSKTRITEVLEFFVGYFGLVTDSYGINYIFKIPCAEPNKWIVDNILSSQIYEKTRNKLIGGSGIISLKSNNKTWNIKIESTGDKEITVDFNASEVTNKLPEAKILVEELEVQWNSLTKFMIDLGMIGT